MLNKYYSKNPKLMIQWRIVLPMIGLITIGMMTLYSTKGDTELLKSTFYRQLIHLGIGFILFYIIQYFRVTLIYEMAYLVYLILLFGLIITFFMPEISGASRWIIIGPIQFQPAEVGKLILIFVLAKYLADFHENSTQWKLIAATISIAIIPAALIFKQPDLGTAIIFPAVTFPMLYWSGIRPYYLFIIAAPAISLMAAFNLTLFYCWVVVLIIVLFLGQPKLRTGIFLFFFNVGFGTLSTVIWDKLYFHQKERIFTFLDPTRDPQGAGYQILQSITAIGSGGLTGKGFGQGSQTHLRFLPVRDTDFIISVIGEEHGFIGICIVLFLFFVMLYWMIVHARKMSNRYSSFTIMGFSSIIFIHLIVNMGMAIGLLPVTGLPLPFISYSGSFLLSMIIIVGITNNLINNDIEL